MVTESGVFQWWSIDGQLQASVKGGHSGVVVQLLYESGDAIDETAKLTGTTRFWAIYVSAVCLVEVKGMTTADLWKHVLDSSH